MAKYPGVGEIQEGLVERDPLDETCQLRFLDPTGRQQVLRLQEVFAEYVGHEVRLTVAFTAALRRAMEQAEATRETEAVVTFGDFSKET